METEAAHCGSAAQGIAGVNLAAIQSCTTWASASVTHCFRPEQAELCVVVSVTQAKENSWFFFFSPFQHNQFSKAEYRSGNVRCFFCSRSQGYLLPLSCPAEDEGLNLLALGLFLFADSKFKPSSPAGHLC